MNLADAITRHAGAAPHAVALAEAERGYSYAQLEAAIWRVALELRRLGLRPGDVVGVSLPSNALHVVVAYALARMGAVQIELPPRDPAAVRDATARRFGAATVIGEANADPAWLEGGADPDPALRAEGGEWPRKVVFTSGTTAEPKAVLQSHAHHVRWRELTQAALRVQADERYLATVGVHFTAGMRMVMEAHWAGAAAIVGDDPVTPEDFLELAERRRASYLYLTPSHLQRLLPALPERGPRLPAVRRLRTGSMVLTPDLCRAIRERLTPHVLLAYGTNDFGSPITFADAGVLARFPDSVGFRMPGVEVEVADESGRALPPGKVGRVRARMSPMPREYIGNPKATAAAFRDGWYYPGDLATFLPQGALVLQGRMDDLMNVDGIKVYPAEIEATLLGHPAVAEAAAFPVGAAAGSRPAAAVTLRSPATAAELRAYCAARLAAKAPHSIAIMLSLPRTAAGKVDRRALAGLVAARRRRA